MRMAANRPLSCTMATSDILPEVFRAALSDPSFGDSRSRELTDQLILHCAQSPAALRRLVQLRPISERTARWYHALFEEVLPKWSSDTAERAFLDWVERRTRDSGILQLIEFRRMCHRLPTRELLLSPSQQEAWNQLHRMADLFFSDAWHRYRIAPNYNALIVGQSGSGKSFLVSTFAAARRLPLMRMAYSQWIVQGARRQPDTVTQLASFIEAHEKACVFVDEMDKAGPGENQSEWGAGVAGDVYAMLDRTLFDSQTCETESKRRAMRDRLRRSVFVVTAGTWQAELRHSGRRVGFARGEPVDPRVTIAAARRIPEELLRRVSGQTIVLAPPSAQELREICRAEGLEAGAHEVGIELNYNEAVASGDAMRWLGNARLQIDLKRHKQSRPHWQAPSPIRFEATTEPLNHDV